MRRPPQATGSDHEFSELTEQNIARWDRIFASRAWGKYPPEELVRFIARTFPDPAHRRGMKVLEVGCGPGANLWYLAREGFAVAGIDGSPHAIASARNRLNSEGLAASAQAADLRVGNFANLPWSDSVFDAIIDIEAIYANPMSVIEAVLAEIARVLKPGGWLFAKMFGRQTSGAVTGTMLEEGTTKDPTSGPMAGYGLMHTFTEDEIRELLRPLRDLGLDWVHRSDKDRQHDIFEWLVQARK